MKKLLILALMLSALSAHAREMVCKVAMWEQPQVSITFKEVKVGGFNVSFEYMNDQYKGMATGLMNETSINLTAVVRGEYSTELLIFRIPSSLLTKGQAVGELKYLLRKDFEKSRAVCEIKP